MTRLFIIFIASLLFAGCLPYQQVENPNRNNLDLAHPTGQPTPTEELKVDLFGGKKQSAPTSSVSPSPAINMQDILKPGPNQQFQAILHTSLGDIKVELYPKVAPVTVTNFVGLAEGSIEWLNPKTNQKVLGTPLFNQTIFHRVIKDFMIQGGDPLGTGTGSPGYKFQDEFNPQYTFDGPGVLAMANSGPNSNGSQFFITHAATTWLNGKHTIFGKVIEGMDVVDAIATTPVGANDKPVTDVVLNSVEIIRQ